MRRSDESPHPTPPTTSTGAYTEDFYNAITVQPLPSRSIFPHVRFFLLRATTLRLLRRSSVCHHYLAHPLQPRSPGRVPLFVAIAPGTAGDRRPYRLHCRWQVSRVV